MYYDYFLRYGHPTSWPKFLRAQVPREQSQNCFNFWVSQNWCHSIEMKMDRMMMSSIWFDHVWFLRNLHFFNSPLLHHFDLLYDLDLKKFLSIFIFLNCITFERETSCLNVTCMVFWCIFIKILFFKVWTQIFLHRGNSSKTQNFQIFSNYILYGRGRDYKIIDPTIMKTLRLFPEIQSFEIWIKTSLGTMSKIFWIFEFQKFDIIWSKCEWWCPANGQTTLNSRDTWIFFFFCLNFLDDPCWKNQIQKFFEFPFSLIFMPDKRGGYNSINHSIEKTILSFISKKWIFLQ